MLSNKAGEAGILGFKVDKDTVKIKEEANDGRSIYLYYDAMAGMYLAYGLSAYYTTLVTDPYMSYSEVLEMPVALLRREQILYLRQSLKKVEHEVKQYYQFQMRAVIGDSGYDRWARNIQKKHLQVIG